WPGWAKAILIAQLVLMIAVIVPWVFMWGMCAGMAGMQMPSDMMQGR
ncbi:MAG: hypothetical protein HYX56_05340, partial [Chloroflexi bacterium]|nr:hypothetical protein [Chloroflexota bacterium]